MRVDTIYQNGRIYTVDPAHPHATKVAVLGGRIVAIDDEAETVTANQTVDLGGYTVVPGFHDAHVHITHFGLSLDELDISSPPMRSVDDVYQAIANRAQSTPPGSWIVGAGYDQNKIGGHPRRAQLDAVAPGHHVWLQHASRHMCVVNSRVLDHLDLSQIPDGGIVEKDTDGSPTGLIQEQAQNLVRALRYPYPLQRIIDAIDLASQHFLREGITSVQEAGIGGGWIGHSPAELAAFQAARDQQRLHVRTTAMVAAGALHPLSPSGKEPLEACLDLGARTGLGDDWLRLGAVKVFADGSLIGRTAAMHEPFDGEPGNRGFLQADPDELRALIVAAHRSGWQVATHAIGDRAIDLVLDIYRDALARYPRKDHRHRIEHCAVATRDAVRTMAELGVIPNPQGRFIGALGDGMANALGPARTRNCYRQRSFLNWGVTLPASSDRPVVNGAPLAGIHDLVNQRTDSGRPFNPDEALTAAQALHAYTVGSATAAFLEGDRGSITPGKLADFAVLSEDLLLTSPSRIREIEVITTVIGGNVVYDKAGLGTTQPLPRSPASTVSREHP